MQQKDKDSIFTLIAIVGIVGGFIAFNIFSKSVNPIWLLVIVAAIEVLILMPMAINKFNKVWEPEENLFDALKNIGYVGPIFLFILAVLGAIATAVCVVLLMDTSGSAISMALQEKWLLSFIVPFGITSILIGAWFYCGWSKLCKFMHNAGNSVDFTMKALAILLFIPVGRAIALSNMISVANTLIMLGYNPYDESEKGDGFSDYDDEEVESNE